MISHLLPHDPPMVLLDEVIAHRDDFIHTALTITAESAFCQNGAVPSYVAIEYMAQTIAAWKGLIAAADGLPPQIGFLLGSRKLNLLAPAFKIGEKLDVYGQPLLITDEMAVFECWIEVQGKQVAHANLNVFQPNGDFNAG